MRRPWPFVAMLTSCLPHQTTGVSVPRSTEYRVGHKTVKVRSKTPSSMDSGQLTECVPAGDVAPEQLVPIIAFIEKHIPSHQRPLAWVLVVDASLESSLQPVFEANASAMAIDVRKEHGMVIVSYGSSTDYFCTSVTEARTEIIVTLDLFKGLRP